LLIGEKNLGRRELARMVSNAACRDGCFISSNGSKPGAVHVSNAAHHALQAALEVGIEFIDESGGGQEGAATQTPARQ